MRNRVLAALVVAVLGPTVAACDGAADVERAPLDAVEQDERDTGDPRDDEDLEGPGGFQPEEHNGAERREPGTGDDRRGRP